MNLLVESINNEKFKGFWLKVFFPIETLLEKVRKSIYSSIDLIFLIIFLKMLPKEFLGLLDLTKA